MHAKTDSEATSIDATSSWPPRSPPRATRPVYYVQSPSNHDVEKMSFGSGCSPMGSPAHPNYYHCSPIHHSRESSTSRFSDSLKPHRSLIAYKSLHDRHDINGRDRGDDDEDDETDGGDRGRGRNLRLYFCLFLSFVLLFAVFSLILWGASKSYDPKIVVKGMVFENFNVQAGNDESGVPTDMLSLNSTVRILYRNPATFFAVHVTSTPFELRYFQLKLASGLGMKSQLLQRFFEQLVPCSRKPFKEYIRDMMKKFTQPRKGQRSVVTVVHGHQVPLYGGVSVLSSQRDHPDKVSLPLNLTFVMRSRAYILGRLVKSKFYTRIRCSVTLRGNKLGKHVNLTESCIYQ